MIRGDVYWYERPDQKRRPALVLTRSRAIPVVNSVVIAPATRTIRGIPTELIVGTDEGMPEESAFTFDNVRVVRKANLTRYICTLPAHLMAEACRALTIALDC